MLMLANPLRRYLHPVDERVENPGVIGSLVVLGVLGVGGYVAWKHFRGAPADAGGSPSQQPRPMTGSVGRFAWSMDRKVKQGANNAPWYWYDWDLYDGNVLIANGDEAEYDDQLAYDKAKSQIDATIVKHGG